MKTRTVMLPVSPVFDRCLLRRFRFAASVAVAVWHLADAGHRLVVLAVDHLHVAEGSPAGFAGRPAADVALADRFAAGAAVAERSPAAIFVAAVGPDLFSERVKLV